MQRGDYFTMQYNPCHPMFFMNSAALPSYHHYGEDRCPSSIALNVGRPTPAHHKEDGMHHPGNFKGRNITATSTKKKNATRKSISMSDTEAFEEDIMNHFPSKLHRLLVEIDLSDGLSVGLEVGCREIISWQPHGHCFMIRDEALFIEKVMPKWFQNLKFSSFRRLLHLYGFRKFGRKGPDKGSYFNEQFSRDKPELARSMRPIKGKGKRGRKRRCEVDDPDFYSDSARSVVDVKTKDSADPVRAVPDKKLPVVTQKAGAASSSTQGNSKSKKLEKVPKDKHHSPKDGLKPSPVKTLVEPALRADDDAIEEAYLFNDNETELALTGKVHPRSNDPIEMLPKYRRFRAVESPPPPVEWIEFEISRHNGEGTVEVAEVSAESSHDMKMVDTGEDGMEPLPVAEDSEPESLPEDTKAYSPVNEGEDEVAKDCGSTSKEVPPRLPYVTPESSRSSVGNFPTSARPSVTIGMPQYYPEHGYHIPFMERTVNMGLHEKYNKLVELEKQIQEQKLLLESMRPHPSDFAYAYPPAMSGYPHPHAVAPFHPNELSERADLPQVRSLSRLGPDAPVHAEPRSAFTNRVIGTDQQQSLPASHNSTSAGQPTAPEEYGCL